MATRPATCKSSHQNSLMEYSATDQISSMRKFRNRRALQSILTATESSTAWREKRRIHSIEIKRSLQRKSLLYLYSIQGLK